MGFNSGFKGLSDTSYTTKKLGHTAEKNRKSMYVIGMRGREQSEAEKPSYWMNLHLNIVF